MSNTVTTTGMTRPAGPSFWPEPSSAPGWRCSLLHEPAPRCGACCATMPLGRRTTWSSVAETLGVPLSSVERNISSAVRILYGKPDMVPLSTPVAEVCAVAKKDLQPGDKLDAIGEYCYRAWIMTAPEARSAAAIPCGMLQGGKVTAPIKKGELITYANASVAEGSRLAALRARQDALVYGREA